MAVKSALNSGTTVETFIPVKLPRRKKQFDISIAQRLEHARLAPGGQYLIFQKFLEATPRSEPEVALEKQAQEADASARWLEAPTTRKGDSATAVESTTPASVADGQLVDPSKGKANPYKTTKPPALAAGVLGSPNEAAPKPTTSSRGAADADFAAPARAADAPLAGRPEAKDGRKSPPAWAGVFGSADDTAPMPAVASHSSANSNVAPVPWAAGNRLTDSQGEEKKKTKRPAWAGVFGDADDAALAPVPAPATESHDSANRSVAPVPWAAGNRSEGEETKKAKSPAWAGVFGDADDAPTPAPAPMTDSHGSDFAPPAWAKGVAKEVSVPPPIGRNQPTYRSSPGIPRWLANAISSVRAVRQASAGEDILIVEDNPMQCKLYKHRAKKGGLTVLITASGTLCWANP